MIPCPSPQQLQHLLSEQLSGPERDRVEAHVEGCRACQQVLEDLNDTFLAGAGQTPEAGGAGPGSATGFLRRLAQVSPAGPTGPAGGDGGGDAAEVGARLGGYELLGVLGKGGMGVVYQARQAGLGRLVALKVIRAEHADAQQRARFRREAEALARLHHPGVVQVHEVGEEGGRPYLALEYVEGGTLAQRLAGTPLLARQAAALLEALARAVQAAHEQGIIHRDLKPANVLLAPAEPGRGVTLGAAGAETSCAPKVTDFGLAKPLREGESGLTQTGVILGTPSYMAPEQARAQERDVGPRTDVYALGAILYECLTGRPPFKAATALQTLEQVCSREPAPPAQLQPGLPRDLETVCLKCLHKEPQRRYGSAAALAEDLGRFLADRPVQARPVGQLGRAWRWCRRNPWVAGLAAAVVFSLLAGVMVSLGQAARAIRERDDKLLALEEARIKERKAHEAAEAATKAQADRDFHGRQAEAVGDLLEALFYEPHPDHLTRDFRGRMVQRLEQVAGRLEEQYPGDPLVRARLRNTLGQTYTSLGWYAKAAAQHEKALEERRALLRPDHPDTLASTNALAEAYRMAGRLDKALPLFEQVLPKMKAELGPDHPITLSTMTNLAFAYGDTGQQLDKSLSLFEQVFQKNKASRGPDNAETLLAMHNLAQAYVYYGQLARGIPLLEQVLHKWEAARGPDHLDTLMSASRLAGAYLIAGQCDKALPLCEQARAKMTAKLGPGHPEALRTAYDLGQCYMGTAQTDKALAVLEPALQTVRVALGPDHPDTLICMGHLGVAYLLKGQPDRARPLLEQALAGMKKARGLDFSGAHVFILNLAVLHEQRGELDRAAALFAEALALGRKHGPIHAGLTPLLLDLGRVRTRQKKYAEAEPLLLEAFEVLTSPEGRAFGPPEQARETAMRLLLELYAAWGRNDKVAQWLGSLSRHHCERGVALLRQDKLAEAEAAFREALRLNPNEAWAPGGIARICARRGQWDEAVAAFRRNLELGPRPDADWYYLALVWLHSGDVESYRGVCREMLARFGRSDRPETASLTAKVCVLAPEAVEDLAAVVKLADLALRGAEKHRSYRGFLLTAALTDYRSGHYAAAAERLGRFDPRAGGEHRDAAAFAVLALAQHRRGRAEEARAALSAARAILDKKLPDPGRGKPFGDDWNLWLECQILTREAQLLIPGKADDPPGVQNEVAWLLATAAVPQLRDPARAVELARKAVGRAPEQGAYWKTLGAAQYRAGDWKAAVAALDKAQALAGGDGAVKLFLAMARWQLGQREQARQGYDDALAAQAKAKSKDEDFARFRAEAHVLLDLPRLARVRRVEWLGVHVYHTAFSPGGRSYLAAGDTGPLRLWDVATGKQLQVLKGHEGWTSQATFTPDGKQVLSGGTDRCLRLWDVATGRQVRTFTGHTADVLSVAISPDGHLALSGSADKTVRLWELATGTEVRRLNGHADRAIFSPDGRHVLSFGADQTLRLWQADTGKPVRTLAGHTGPVAGACFLPGGRQVVSYAADNTVRVWDVASGAEVRRHALAGDHCAIGWLALTPDGRGFLTNHQDYTVRWHDLASGREWHRVAVPPAASPQGLSVSPDGRHAADGSFRGFVYLFRLAGGVGGQAEKQVEPAPGAQGQRGRRASCSREDSR